MSNLAAMSREQAERIASAPEANGARAINEKLEQSWDTAVIFDAPPANRPAYRVFYGSSHHLSQSSAYLSVRLDKANPFGDSKKAIYLQGTPSSATQAWLSATHASSTLCAADLLRDASALDLLELADCLLTPSDLRHALVTAAIRTMQSQPLVEGLSTCLAMGTTLGDDLFAALARCVLVNPAELAKDPAFVQLPASVLFALLSQGDDSRVAMMEVWRLVKQWATRDGQVVREILRQPLDDGDASAGNSVLRALPWELTPAACLVMLLQDVQPYLSHHEYNELAGWMTLTPSDAPHELWGHVRNMFPTKGYVRIEAGEFLKGEAKDPDKRFYRDTRERVRIARPFMVKVTPVTQAEWQQRMGNNPSFFREDGPGDELASARPVEQVNKWEALAYCNALSRHHGFTEVYDLSACAGTPGTGGYTGPTSIPCNDLANGYRLLTDDEWEYALRAGKVSKPVVGPDPTLPLTAWFKDNGAGRTHPVAQKQPNAWGLYDMLGNVSEWVSDGTDENGRFTHARGGSSSNYAGQLCPHASPSFLSSARDKEVGFRTARSLM